MALKRVRDPVPVPGMLREPSASSPSALLAEASQERNRQGLCRGADRQTEREGEGKRVRYAASME